MNRKGPTCGIAKPRSGEKARFGRLRFSSSLSDFGLQPCFVYNEFRFSGAFMRHVISALVMNEPGVLANVANLFSARGFNIDSLVVGRTENPELSRMTVVC